MTFKEIVENNPVFVTLGVISSIAAFIISIITIYEFIEKRVSGFGLPVTLIGIGILIDVLGFVLASVVETFSPLNLMILGGVPLLSGSVLLLIRSLSIK